VRARLTFALLAAAVLWGALLLVGAFTYPAYEGTSVVLPCPDCPPVEQPAETKTLVEVNGPSVLFPVGVPLAAALGVAGLLRVRSRTGSEGAMIAAWVQIGLVTAFALISMFSIGGFVLPSAVLLAAAALTAPRPPEGARSSEAARA
jgi:hypothetical protein